MLNNNKNLILQKYKFEKNKLLAQTYTYYSGSDDTYSGGESPLQCTVDRNMLQRWPGFLLACPKQPILWRVQVERQRWHLILHQSRFWRQSCCSELGGKTASNLPTDMARVNFGCLTNFHDGWWFVCCSKMWRNKTKQRFSEMHFVAQATSTVFVQLRKPTGVLPSTKQSEENKTFPFWQYKEQYTRLTITSEWFLSTAANNH